MPRYSNVLGIKEARDLAKNKIAWALQSIEDGRKVLDNYRDLPKVGTPYVLVDAGTTTQNGIDIYGTEVYLDEDSGLYYEDIVLWQNQVFTITASHDDPEIFLKMFKMKRSTPEWKYQYFGVHNLGIVRIGDVVDRSVVINGGDYEIRYSMTFEVNYLSKSTTEIENYLESVSGSITVPSDNEDVSDITEEF